MMTPQEQAAFVEAYANNVADATQEQVTDFVRRYADGEDIDYSSDYTSIMDALCMWNSALKWQMELLLGIKETQE
jgi:hypothetical protein